MKKIDAFAAIAARKNGIWDDPALMSIGELSIDPAYDIETIQRKFLTACDFSFGWRDPRVKPAYPGCYMVVEDIAEIGDPDGWAIVGDDMRALINEAFEYADSAGYDECIVP